MQNFGIGGWLGQVLGGNPEALERVRVNTPQQKLDVQAYTKECKEIMRDIIVQLRDSPQQEKLMETFYRNERGHYYYTDNESVFYSISGAEWPAHEVREIGKGSGLFVTFTKQSWRDPVYFEKSREALAKIKNTLNQISQQELTPSEAVRHINVACDLLKTGLGEHHVDSDRICNEIRESCQQWINNTQNIAVNMNSASSSATLHDFV
jgi:regulator of sirC expression with transglutaminase-like and TPR domain